jgi:hypothetical protein
MFTTQYGKRLDWEANECKYCQLTKSTFFITEGDINIYFKMTMMTLHVHGFKLLLIYLDPQLISLWLRYFDSLHYLTKPNVTLQP